jgi:choline dehydrogenase-like flavoprotein
MVATVTHNEHGRVTGVLYFRGDDTSALHLQKAHNVAVCGYAIETPRLLLDSASSMFPDGLANSSGLVGKCFMVHSGHQVFARFDERINQYKAPPGLALTEHFNRTMPGEGFVCGYTIEAVGPHLVDFAARVTTARGLWGAELRRVMLDYNYYSGIGIVGVLRERGRAGHDRQTDNRDHDAHAERGGYSEAGAG